ncbi:MAG: hypothetical protein ACRC41_16085 [Sarcina sp.]
MENLKIDLVKEIAKEVIKELEIKKAKENYSKRLHNTRLLMENYNSLKNHIEKTDDTSNLINGIDEEDEIFIESIVRTKMRTIKMMSYVDSALKVVKLDLRKKREKYKFLAFEKYYFEKKSIDDICLELNCSKNSVRRWNSYIMEELSLLLWGVDFLSF